MAKISNLKGERWVTSREKREVDIALALASLPVALPIGALALAASRLVDGKGAWFTQQRRGRGEALLTLSKIRTMKGHNGGPAVGREDEITCLGSLLRPIGVDELPQLINVLSGTMSIVGPRPHPIAAHEQMMTNIDPDLSDEWNYVRKKSRPGLFSSYGLMLREHPERVFNHDANLKAELDISDFYSDSLERDLEMILKAAQVGARVCRKTFDQPTTGAQIV